MLILNKAAHFNNFFRRSRQSMHSDNWLKATIKSPVLPNKDKAEVHMKMPQ